MEGGRLIEFLDGFTFEGEAWIYDGHRYFTDGIVKDESGFSYFILKFANEDELCEECENFHEFTADNWEACLEDFKNAKIYNGKSFMDIEQETTWVDV